MINIWFNHWFSTAYNIVKMVKQASQDYRIIGTNEHARATLSAVCDEWYTEPALRGDEYVEFCLDFCVQHQIDAFLPKREMLSISKRKSDFERCGVKVMVDDYDIVSILSHKDRAYQKLSAQRISTIPDYRIVSTSADFREACQWIRERYEQVCFKFVHDEGGKSFRLIDDHRKGYAALFKKQNTRMTMDAVLDALSERETFFPIIVMPYLPGEEISVDCLQTHKGLIMLPRVKDATRIERLSFQRDILEKTQEIYNVVKLEWPCNIQFKFLDGVPYFLEINTRMSGGVPMACAAARVNLPGIAVNKLFGIKTDWTICQEERYITHAEVPVLL